MPSYIQSGRHDPRNSVCGVIPFNVQPHISLIPVTMKIKHGEVSLGKKGATGSSDDKRCHGQHQGGEGVKSRS